MTRIPWNSRAGVFRLMPGISSRKTVPPFGDFELVLFAVQRAGEGPLLEPEEFAFQRSLKRTGRLDKLKRGPERL
jgi:hypothetical protein